MHDLVFKALEKLPSCRLLPSPSHLPNYSSCQPWSCLCLGLPFCLSISKDPSPLCNGQAARSVPALLHICLLHDFLRVTYLPRDLSFPLCTMGIVMTPQPLGHKGSTGLGVPGDVPTPGAVLGKPGHHLAVPVICPFSHELREQRMCFVFHCASSAKYKH